MKSALRTGLLAAGLLGLVHATALAGSYEDGMTAFRGEDYAKALSLLLPFAKLGNAEAQLKLGWWLMKGGDVVKQDQAAGMNWLLMAANQGEPQAQYEVGLGYWKGRGVKPDPIAAYMWLELCSGEPGFDNAAVYRDEIAKTMTPEQINQAKLMVQAFTPKRSE